MDTGPRETKLSHRAMYDALVSALEELPDSVVIRTTRGDVQGTYRALVGALGLRE